LGRLKTTMTMREDQTNFLNAYGKFFTEQFGATEEQILQLQTDSKYKGFPQEPGGSVWTSEGQSIYVLIRLLKPKKILEIGNYLGRSSNFILKAVEDNGFGEVVLLDLFERIEYDKLHKGTYQRVIEDSLKYVARPLDFDLFVIDGCHEYVHVKKEMELILKNTTKPFWAWSHDYFTVRPPQCEVGKALDEVVAANKDKFKVFAPMIEKTSNCGIVISKVNP